MFTLANWACTSGSLNQGQETVTPYGGSPTVLNAPNIFFYGSPTDVVATITGAGYFNSMAADLCVGDWIQGNGTDTTFSVYVVSITAGVVSVASTIQGSLTPLAISGNFLIQPAANNLTAHAGGGQASAYPVTYPINNFTTVATANDSVKLPVSVAGMEVILINDAANPMQVFGAGTDTVDDVATATGVSQLGKSVVLYTSPVAGKWYSLGLGLTFTGEGGGGLTGLGIHSATFSSSFPTASTVVTDAAILAASVVIARFVSSANVVTTQTVLPAAGQFTIVTDTAPSTGVLEYISFVPQASLVTAGVVGGKGSYGGGSATFVINDAAITSGMVVNANFESQVTPSRIYTVIAGAGTLTFVCSANPGVSVVDYMAVSPSAALTASGLEAVNYSYAGGFASIVISDANITSSSIVTADFKSQSVVALIQKVTPSAGTLTILASIDPGPSVVAYIAASAAAGGSPLLSTNNLSDVVSASISATNIGLGTGNNVVFTNIQAGSSGVAGHLSSFPSAATSGSLLLTAVTNSSGNFNTTVSNASAVGQSQVVSIPDSGASTANFILSKNAGTQHITSGALQVDAGLIASGLATGGFIGTLQLFPTTTTTGSLRLISAANAANYNVDLTNASFGQSSVLTIPDVGAATGKFVMSGGSLVSGNFLSASGTAGLAIDSGIPISSGRQFAQVAMTAAQFNGMYAAPFLLVATPGSNKMIVVESIQSVMTYVSANYAAGGVVAAQYDSTANGAGVLASSTEAAADFFAAASTVFKMNGGLVLAPFTTCANKGLYLSNVTQAFTTGDSTWIIKVYYHVISTNS